MEKTTLYGFFDKLFAFNFIPSPKFFLLANGKTLLKYTEKSSLGVLFVLV